MAANQNIVGGMLEAHEKLTGILLFQPTGETGYIDLGNVVDYKVAHERQYRTRARAQYGVRIVNDEQVDVINPKFEFTLDEVGVLAQEALLSGTHGGSTTQAAKAPIEVTTLAQSAGTATCDTATNHGLTTGDRVLITGATPAAFNGVKTVTVTDSNTFTFAIDSGTSSPATGTIVVRKAFTEVTDAELGRTYFLAATGVSALQVYKASDMSLVSASANYTTDLSRGSVSILATASGITEGDELVIGYTTPLRTFETWAALDSPLKTGTVLFLEVNQHSKEALRRTSFPGALSIVSRPEQSGEFGKFAIRLTPTAAMSIEVRQSRV